MIIFITFILHCLWVKKKWKILQLQGILRTLSKYRLNSALFPFLVSQLKESRKVPDLPVRKEALKTSHKKLPTLSGVVLFFDFLFVC